GRPLAGRRGRRVTRQPRPVDGRYGGQVGAGGRGGRRAALPGRGLRTTGRLERGALAGRRIRGRSLPRRGVVPFPGGEQEGAAADSQGGEGDHPPLASPQPAGDGGDAPVMVLRRGVAAVAVLRRGERPLPGQGCRPARTRSTTGGAVPAAVATPRRSGAAL